MLKPITLEVDEAIADNFNNATIEHRHKIQAIVSSLLYYVNQPDSLENIVKEIRQEAFANGLTSEILQALLNDE
ncbi:hypothetical protein Syn7502_03530 [Synechococcus sp. PCC 7502]|uniref:hypothetical protein n=1 Tax=Synechococcus sp. PCC 7502 TaxID=1173263 RepID=UPI00029FC7D4|nr:hypothetical protein [Synechococcus sp. PCC 7502]AFY75369.1 hypothetical protein Syn7502_03530 [Synechococcus sp. PCC 7502]